MVTTLILVRHGETVENIAGITQGHLNSQLSEKGKEQIKRVAAHLKKKGVDICYSSDLDRCMNTAKEIIKFHSNVKIIATRELREQTKGKYEGAKKEITKAAIKKLSIPYVEWDYDGAESFIEMNKRTMKEIYKIVKENKDKTVLVVAHGAQIASIVNTINNEDIYHRKHHRSNNCAITVIEFDDNGKGTVKEFDNTEHLN